MPKKTKLEQNIHQHIKELGSPEMVAEFYGLDIGRAKAAYRTGNATLAMADTYINFTPSAAAATDSSAGDVVERKVDELIETVNGVIAHVNVLSQHMNEMLAPRPLPYAQPTQYPAPAPAPVAPPIAFMTSSNPAPAPTSDGFLEPEMISSIRPGRVSVQPLTPDAYAEAPKAVIYDGGAASGGPAFDYLSPHKVIPRA